MSGRVSAHIRQSVVGYLALFFAMTGGAWALSGHNTVRSDDIVNGQVKRPDISNGAVTGAKVANGSLTGLNVADESIGAAKIAPDSVTGADVADGSLGGGDFQNDSISSTQLAPGAIDAASLAPNAIPADGSGSNGSTKVADGAIRGTEVGDGSLTNADLALNTIGADKLNRPSLYAYGSHDNSGTVALGSGQTEVLALRNGTGKLNTSAFPGTQHALFAQAQVDVYGTNVSVGCLMYDDDGTTQHTISEVGTEDLTTPSSGADDKVINLVGFDQTSLASAVDVYVYCGVVGGSATFGSGRLTAFALPAS